MSERVLTNFRGMRALVLHPDDSNRDTLMRTLGRLGLTVFAADPEANRGNPLASCDILFFDADQPQDLAASTKMPTVAIVGAEAPSRLARIVRDRCCGYLIKPLRATGIYTSLVIACSEFARRQRDASELSGLAARLAGRRSLVKALLRLMAAEGIDDDEAYRRLRCESMRRRVPVETVARELLEAAPAGRTAPHGRQPITRPTEENQNDDRLLA